MKPLRSCDSAIASRAVQPRRLPIQWESGQRQEIPLGPPTLAQLKCLQFIPQPPNATTVPRYRPALTVRLQLSAIITAVWLVLNSFSLHAYERLQGPTQLNYWDKTKTYDGYTLFGAQGITYLLDMQGRVVHTWR